MRSTRQCVQRSGSAHQEPICLVLLSVDAFSRAARRASTPCKAALLRLQSSESLGSVKQAPSMSVLSKPDSPCSESGLFKRKLLPATFTTSARGAAREGQWCGRGASGAMHTGATLKGVFTAHDPRSRAEACSNACPAQHPLQQLTPTASKGWDKVRLWCVHWCFYACACAHPYAIVQMQVFA